MPLLAATLLCLGLGVTPAAAEDREPVATAILDFENDDTAGESPERTAEHAERVAAFAGILRRRLAAEQAFEVVTPDCPSTPCTVSSLPAGALREAVRKAGARLLVYGGIHKMSTLVQFGLVEAIDLKKDQVVLSHSFSFRGDSDEAFRRAAEFILRYLERLTLEP